MSGYDNIKEYGFDKRTADERRELAIKAGKASGKARRRKADFRRTLNMLLTTEIDNPEWNAVLKAMGLDCTLESAVNAAMIKAALDGDVKAYEAIAKYSGQSMRTDADHEEQRIRTDRARRARDLETGREESGEESINNFLKAMSPTEDDIKKLFKEQEGDNEESSEEADDI